MNLLRIVTSVKPTANSGGGGGGEVKFSSHFNILTFESNIYTHQIIAQF